MKRFSIILLGALAIVMAGCSKNIEPTSPDPDAWMHDASLPVPVLFSTGSQPMTKATAIDAAADMVGKDFGFFAFHQNMASWGSSSGNTFADNGIVGWKQNLKGTIATVPATGNVQFTFDDGPYYYPQSSVNNYTFYGYHAHVLDEEVRPQSGSVSVVVALGHNDILWAKAAAEDITDAEGTTYQGFNARYIRKSLENGAVQHPLMAFEHLTSAVSFSAKTDKSVFAEENPGKDIVTINKISILNTNLKANLCIAHKTDESKEGTLAERTSDIGAIDSGNITVQLDETPKPLIGQNNYFFIMPTEEGEGITVQLDYTVDSGEGKVITSSSTYELKPEVQKGDMAGKVGFFAGYRYDYNFIVYTPERIVIEATVEPYEEAFNGPVDVLPKDE
ncbi:MAG: fimbrillin family protein [Bacteroidales bacterium]|nr:fimbrillin family protein [Bacteroidales bacterium]